MEFLGGKVDNGGATPTGKLCSDEWNQLATEINNVIDCSGQTPSSTDLRQLKKAIGTSVLAGSFFQGGGVADTYTADAVAPAVDPTALIDGMLLRMIPPVTNTGDSTLNAFSLGVLPITQEDGTTPIDAGDMEAGKESTLIYRALPTPHYELKPDGGGGAAVGTNISNPVSNNVERIIASSTGSGFTLPSATATVAGLMSGANFTKLNSTLTEADSDLKYLPINNPLATGNGGIAGDWAVGGNATVTGNAAVTGDATVTGDIIHEGKYFTANFLEVPDTGGANRMRFRNSVANSGTPLYVVPNGTQAGVTSINCKTRDDFHNTAHNSVGMISTPTIGGLINTAIGEAGSTQYYAVNIGYFSIEIDAGTNVFVRSSATNGVQLTANSNAWAAISQRDRKTDLEVIEPDYDWFKGLELVTGRYKTSPEGTIDSFLIADDYVNKAGCVSQMKETVGSTDEGEPIYAKDTVMGLADTKTLPHAYAVIQGLIGRVDELEAVNSDLIKRLEALEAK